MWRWHVPATQAKGQGKKAAQERRAAPPVRRGTKVAVGGAKGPRKREEHHEVGSMVDSTSYYDPTGPLDNVHGHQQTLDFNTPLERPVEPPVEPDEWSSE